VELEIQPEARNRRRRSLSAAARAIPAANTGWIHLARLIHRGLDFGLADVA